MLIYTFSLIGMCLTHVRKCQRKAAQHLIPIIEERYRLPPEERPNDLLSWLMEDAIGKERDPFNLTVRVLAINFAAIHTTSMVSGFLHPISGLELIFGEDILVYHIPTASSVSHLLKLCYVLTMYASPEYIRPLREEVEAIVNEQGWTKASIFNMRKLDVFFREAQRLGGFSTSKERSNPIYKRLTN